MMLRWLYFGLKTYQWMRSHQTLNIRNIQRFVNPLPGLTYLTFYMDGKSYLCVLQLWELLKHQSTFGNKWTDLRTVLKEARISGVSALNFLVFWNFLSAREPSWVVSISSSMDVILRCCSRLMLGEARIKSLGISTENATKWLQREVISEFERFRRLAHCPAHV